MSSSSGFEVKLCTCDGDEMLTFAKEFWSSDYSGWGFVTTCFCFPCGRGLIGHESEESELMIDFLIIYLKFWNQVQEEKELRGAAEKQKLPYLSVIQLDIIHQSYEDALKKISNPVEPNAPVASDVTSSSEVERILEEVTSKKSVHLDLSSRALRCVPSSLADVCTLSSLNLSNNQLEVGHHLATIFSRPRGGNPLL